MSSIDRPLAGPLLVFKLEEHLRDLRGEESFQRSGRAGRTLAKSGRFRVTLVAMKQGNQIGTHQADSPMTLHLLRGHLRFRAGTEEHELREGQVLFFGPGDAHDIRAEEESALLITLSAIGDDFGGR
ncbi:MAG: cupin domain-containing protein [Gemmatimonadota bacterium]|jgi:quercetin dioxygenase-like cupin family protein|nr:cupin domain-containing protein [Gemmatimonadota bacterium]